MTDKLIIDGENALMGRLASYAAKQALQGKEVEIVNCEKIVISGNRDSIIQRYLIRRRRPNTHFPSMPSMIMKRTIRGMIPYKKGHGLDAIRRIKCYNDVPSTLVNEKKIKSGKVKGNWMTLKELGSMLK